MRYLGIDTSNYATSVAIYNAETQKIDASVKLVLEVQPDHLGLRQSDAVFAHTKNVPVAYRQLAEQTDIHHMSAVGVSAKPRDAEDSYMPCFLTGIGAAKLVADTRNIPLFSFSHQAGHIMSALYGTGFAQERKKQFIAFHLSGGTTDTMLCDLDGAALKIERIASSMDAYAGQIVDRIGSKLGLPFPAGQMLSEIATQSDTKDCAKPVLKGLDCCLSGLENQCIKRILDGYDNAYVARYCLNSIAEIVTRIVDKLIILYGSDMDIIFAGGVMSSCIIRDALRSSFDHVYFCEPAWLSGDNAVGIAILAARAHNAANWENA